MSRGQFRKVLAENYRLHPNGSPESNWYRPLQSATMSHSWGQKHEPQSQSTWKTTRLELSHKTGRAWTHGFLNQKPWHPLSYKNQKRKFEVEQKFLEQERKKESAKKELELEEEHYNSLSYMSSKDIKEYRDKRQLAFMYAKPPGMGYAPSGLEKKEVESLPVKMGQTGANEKRPVITMLKSQAMCSGNTGLLLGMSTPHGGFSPSDENQQLIFDVEEDCGESDKKKRRRKRKEKHKVKKAEEILRAAGYDVDEIKRQIDKEQKSKKKRGNDEQGGYRLFVPSAAVSSRDLPGHTKLKFREPGQNSKEDLESRDLRAELELKERKHFEENKKKDLLLLEESDETRSKPVLVPMAADADEEESEEDVDSDKESEEQSEDEEAELLAELERIKKEREEEAKKKEEERLLKEKEKEEDEMLTGNPLLNKPRQGTSFNMKRRWDEDVIFKNQSRGEPKAVKRFINDTVRSDFHQKFLQRYIK